MDVSVILTYRCNSRCSMCHIWMHPTPPAQEVTLETLQKLPAGIDYLNLTGGEPTLRKDLAEIVDLLYPKARTLEISTNGLFPDKLEPIVRKYPCIKIRISMEGCDAVNDAIRGEPGGFARKKETMRRLIDAGGQDLGFATTIQDENVDELVPMFQLCTDWGIELATSSLHNGFQFHKVDNDMYDRVAVARKIEPLITAMLKTNSVKNWFRAYLNLGLIAKILGHPRLMPCTAGTDFLFVDPWSRVYACNVRPDLLIGSLETETWESLFQGEKARELRERVRHCEQNCWMVASAKTAMRTKFHSRLPRWKPLRWVLLNKIRASLGLPIPFRRYIDYTPAAAHKPVPRRTSYLHQAVQREMHAETDDPYAPYEDAMNR